MPARALAALAVAFAWCLALAAVPAVGQEPVLTPFVADVLWAPNPASGSDGRRHLVYELRVANTTASGLALNKVEVLDEPSGKLLLSLDRDGLGTRFSIGGRRGSESADLGVGQFGVLFLHVALEPGDLPRAIAHRLSLRLVQPDIDFSATVARTPVVGRPEVVLGPPLLGTGYVAADGCCDSIRHVRALLALNGHFTLAQRFAIDWEQIDSENRVVKGDTKTLSNYVIYGRDVLAVADGTVVSSRNDLPEQVPGALPQGMTIDQADGNFVVLDIGGGNYVLYAHMQPGSVTVKAGARVKRGDVLGKVGNTGNTQAPHLHLHVMDGPSPLASNGLPYVFDSFKLTAVDKAGTADFDKAEATGSPLTLTPVSPPQVLSRVLPLDLSVVEFAR
ncbi:M23 family metallopeptidase [Reyranella soli]|uniref:Peptidase M23 n=1 Tax=Reyranella soli TaxID=1230389 RepID=A0A512NBW1_9HYPH|nr:M23 family metallopeptidase [Reyranella soli]GEP56424.1 peptidase M23 [Reyranella soli]